MEVDEYKYLGVYPSCLFECYDGTHRMCFILSLKHTPPDETKELMEILHYCGANVSKDLKDADGYTAIIADHSDRVNFFGPVFTLNYLKDCLELCKLQDISNYRQDTSKDILEAFSCMRVVYFRFCTWDSVICESTDDCVQQIESTSEERSCETDINTHVSEDVSNCPSVKSPYFPKEERVKQKADSTSNVKKHVKSPYFPNEGRVKQKADSTSNVKKHTRKPYSYKEKRDILKYIIQHSEYSRIKGQQMWVVMERRKICPNRTWQSMKEHFLKSILPDLNSFNFLTDSEKKMFKNDS